MTNKTKEQAEQLRKLMRDILERDDALRKQYDIDKKFRFIRDRLDALSSKVEEQFEQLQEMEEKSQEKSLQEDEVYVYVYLYNAQGIVFRTWRNMLNPDVFYEYSINRPIYEKQSQIDAFINNKTNKAQHGYLTVVVKKDDILPEKKEMKDAARS